MTITLNVPRAAHVQVTYSSPGDVNYDGAFLVIGGATNTGTPGSYVATTSLEHFRPADGIGSATFANGEPMNTARCDFDGIQLQSGRILVCGGRTLASGNFYWNGDYTQTGPILASSEAFGFTGEFWETQGQMSFARFNHKLMMLPDGRVLCFGGIGYNLSQPTSTPAPLLECEIYDPATGAWASGGRMHYPRSWVVAEYLVDRGQIIVAGGDDSVGRYRTEIFDVNKLTWTIGSALLTTPVTDAASAIVVIGGYDPSTLNSGSTMEIYVPNADKFMAGGLNGQFTVAAVSSPTVFQYLTQQQEYTISASTSATATPVGAVAGSVVGPFTFDPDEGLTITGEDSVTAQDLLANRQYASINVVDADVFPDEPGWLVFAFGYDYQVGPVPYLGRLSSTSLSIDYTFKFPVTVPSGSLVTLLEGKGAYSPTDGPDIGSFYVTDSPAGRVAAEASLQAAVAGGITLNTTIVYPGDRGLGNEGYPAQGQNKISDKVAIWSGDDIDDEVATAREE
jgi:hypothetical protein